MSDEQIKRHTPVTIFIHWFNAFCWFFLLATGLGLIGNEQLQPLVGTWWPSMMRIIFGSGEMLLVLHIICGLVWTVVFLIYAVFGAKQYVIPFLKEILAVVPSRDVMWLFTKQIQMTMGSKTLERMGKIFGFDAKIPDQGFYNVGQKLFAVPSILGGLVIVITGIIMALSNVCITDTSVVQWSILIHFVTVGFVFAGLLIHIFMASIAIGERPAFISMFTGSVPEEYAKHHHKLWYDEVKGKLDV